MEEEEKALTNKEGQISIATNVESSATNCIIKQQKNITKLQNLLIGESLITHIL